MVYRDMDPREVLIEVLGNAQEARVRLRRALDKMTEADLTDEPGYREVAGFLDAACEMPRSQSTRQRESWRNRRVGVCTASL